MDKGSFSRLIDAYLNGSASDADKALLEAYYEKLQTGTGPELTQRQEDVLEEIMYNNIVSEIRVLPEKKQDIKLWPRIAFAAAATAAVVLGIWFFGSQSNMSEPFGNALTYKNDIAPGKNTATLSLSGGETISLSDRKSGLVMGEKLRYNDGSEIVSASHSSVEMTLSTPRGGTYQVTLSEGTKIWLNADSRLTYGTSLNKNGQRLVRLEGEAYFEVTKDKAHPFIVESAGQKVEVLGTHFNINGYTDQGLTTTTLIEGRVRVSVPGNLTKDIILNPQQQSTLAGKILTVAEASPNATAWINGKFSFYDTPFEQVMKQLARWYDAEVVYPNGVPERKFTGDINRNVNVSEALGLFKFSGLRFTIEGKKIIVNK